MGFLKKLVNATESGVCPVCTGTAGWGARDRYWTCLDSGGEHHGPISDDGGLLTTSEFMEETLMPDPEIRQASHDLRDHLFSGASDRFREALQQGLTVRMEVGQAAALIGSWASDGATEGEAFETACEVVMAGYAWRLCEQAGRRGSPFPALYGLPPAHQRYLDLLAAQPSETPAVLLVSAASETVGAGDPIHHHSPGAISYGRDFLAAGANIARASLVDAAWMNDAQFETLFLNGVCLRDADAGLPPETADTTGVAVKFTSAEAGSAEAQPVEPTATGSRNEPTPRFCTHCGAPASPGPYCSQCGKPTAG
jgi:hypothetical protein